MKRDKRSLVIGIGSTILSDDGIGVHAARAVREDERTRHLDVIELAVPGLVAIVVDSAEVGRDRHIYDGDAPHLARRSGAGVQTRDELAVGDASIHVVVERWRVDTLSERAERCHDGQAVVDLFGCQREGDLTQKREHVLSGIN